MSDQDVVSSGNHVWFAPIRVHNIMEDITESKKKTFQTLQTETRGDPFNTSEV